MPDAASGFHGDPLYAKNNPSMHESICKSHYNFLAKLYPKELSSVISHLEGSFHSGVRGRFVG